MHLVDTRGSVKVNYQYFLVSVGEFEKVSVIELGGKNVSFINIQKEARFGIIVLVSSIFCRSNLVNVS